MSAIYFHNEHSEAEVRGWERAMIGSICNDILLLSLPGHRFMRRNDPIMRIVPPDSYLHQMENSILADCFETWINASDGKLLIPGGSASIFEIALNTALAIGNDPVKLLARLHGQCEIHAYVEENSRTWLASIIEHGRKIGLMRSDSGWENVIALLRSDFPGPVVTSYSVTDGFPNPYLCCDKKSEEDIENFWESPVDEQWRKCMVALRTDPFLELKLDNWNELRFGSGLTGFDVMEFASGKGR